MDPNCRRKIYLDAICYRVLIIMLQNKVKQFQKRSIFNYIDIEFLRRPS